MESRERKMTSEERFKYFFGILNQWMFLKENEIKLTEYFNKHHLGKIAIYGMGNMAGHLIAELQNSDVDVCYIYDKSEREYAYEIPVAKSVKKLEGIDAIVVIEKDAAEQIQCEAEEFQMTIKVICLDQVVFGVAI